MNKLVKFLVVIIVVLLITSSQAKPQLRPQIQQLVSRHLHARDYGAATVRGRPNAIRFERTQQQAAPPLDLNKPTIFLPEYIPIMEDMME